MADKTAGQWIGTIVGAVIGYFNPALGVAAGAALGAFAGGLIDPPKGPNIKGPRIEDLTVQTAQFGAPLARVHGTVGIMGTVVWVENNAIAERIKKKKQGGKGGGGSSTTTTYSYFGTFAVALADAPAEGIAAIQRVWIGSDLIYNAGSDDLETIIASNKVGEIDLSALLSASSSGIRFKFYRGTDDQMPDPRIEAEMGVGNASAYRGTAYIVFYDLPLAKYSNSLMGAQVKVELVSAGDISSPGLLRHDIIQAPTHFAAAAFYRTAVTTSVYAPQWDVFYPSPTSAKKYQFTTTAAKFKGSTSVVDPTGPVNGVSDIDQFFEHNKGPLSGAPEYFGGNNGYFVYRSGIVYGALTGVAAGSRKVFKSDGVGGWGNVVVNNLVDITVSGHGIIFCAAGSGFSDRRIVALSEDLDELYSSTNVPNRQFLNEATFIYWNDGVIYLGFGSGITELFAMDDSLSGPIYGPWDIPAPNDIGEGNYPQGVSFAIDQGIIIRTTHVDNGDGDVHVQRWKMPVVNPIGIPLSDVVEAELLRSELIEPGDIDVSDLESDLVRGYAIAGVQQVRQCLAPLQAAWPFDVIQSGYQLKAVRRGKAPVATISIDELDARAYGDAMGVQLGQSREMDSQLPRQIMVRHLDPAREYGPNQQLSAERQSSNSVDVRDIDIALVLTPDEAAQIADVLHTASWTERTPASFKLPPTYLHLEPSDVVTVVADYGSFELRMGEINYTPDGRLECSATPNAAAAYTSPAVGGQGPVPDGEIPLSTTPELALLDMPLIRNQDDEPGFAAAMAGTTSSWPGGQLFKSIDSEQTWTDIQAWSAPATLGYGRDPLPEHDGAVIDRVNTLTVDLTAGELAAITEAQMMTGLNWFAYGADGRWELGRFAGHTLNADGSSTISTLLRGLRGSEWTTGLHEYGDTFVLLDDPDTMVIGADLTALGIVRQWRGISVGQTIDDAESVDFAYRGVNLKPLSAVHGTAELVGDDWVITWSPRTRLQGSLWKTGVALPVGEATESYQIDILDGADVVRTITSSTPTVTYLEADQITDFGSSQSSINAVVYQISSSVGRGFPLEIAA